MVSWGRHRALFERTQVDYQNDLRPIWWLTLTSGFFVRVNVTGRKHLHLCRKLFGPRPNAESEIALKRHAAVLQATLTPNREL